MNTSTTTPTRFNGVSIYNKAGKLKSNYTNRERLQVLGATHEDVQEFMELFCPDRPHYAITRAKSTDPRDWTTPKGRVSETEVLNHLLGDLLPGKNPRWVAPRSWEVTRWVGIDVDLRNGDYTDFLHRCRQVRRAMKRLGVCNEHLLVSNTPSGGKHYRFFLTGKIRVWEIEHIFRNVGIEECSGKFELFPRMKKGMRLPFGYLPGKYPQQKAWLKFIRRYQNDEVSLVDWRICAAKSERFLELHGPRKMSSPQARVGSPAQPVGSGSQSPVKYASRIQGVPKRERLQTPAALTTDQDEYTHLLSKSPADFTAADARRIWELGILVPGTRVDATKKMAWHLCHRKRFTPKEAVRLLVDWVYQSGAQTSKDVQQDLAEKTRKVEQQIRKIVVWMVEHPPTQHAKTDNHSLFSKAEVDSLIKRLEFADEQSREELLEFALNFLRYAKLHGEATPEGWEASITAAKVMRRWPRSGGSKYKQKRDLLEKLGLVEVTRKEWKTRHGRGRARTYLMKIPPTICTGASLTTREALDYASDKISRDKCQSVSIAGNSIQVDSYKRVAETTQRIGSMEVGNPRDVIQTDHSDLRNCLHDASHQADLLSTPSVQDSTSMFNELQREYAASARESLRLPYLNESRHSDPSPTSPHSPSPLDLPGLRELGLSERALDYLASRPANLGIPKAIRLEIEQVESKALCSASVNSLPPTSRDESSQPYLPKQGVTHAHSHTHAQPGYT